jgi:hypothetical protein
MATADVEKPAIPPARLVIQKRDDGAIVVKVRSEDSSLPDAVFSFRCGDPQYAYWSRQCEAARGSAE